MNYLNNEVMSDYFHLLTEVLTENELFDSTSRIDNVDKTGIALDGHGVAK